MEDTYLDILKKEGVVVIPFIREESLKKFENKFDKTIEEFPEYIDSSEPILAAFGALGNPASFHNPLVRQLRRRQYRAAKEIFAEDNHKNFQILFDRLAKREKGKSIGGESWHRDQAPTSEYTDEIYGGWINLNSDISQYFICAPGTHSEKERGEGFLKISKKQAEIFKKIEKKVEIPPGHWILFYQNIAHRIPSGKIKATQKRLFTGVRLTNSDKNLFDIQDLIEKQAVMYIPSGQIPKLLEINHIRFPKNREKAIEWSQRTFKPQFLREEGYVQIRIPSLEEAQLPKYPKYTKKDFQALELTKINN